MTNTANKIVMNTGESNGRMPLPESVEEIRQDRKKQTGRRTATVWQVWL